MKHVAVLGGGVIGLSIALELTRRGFDVTILEKNTCGGQASGAAAGMLAPYSEIGEDPDDFFRLCLASLRLFEEWQHDVKQLSGLDFEYEKSGSLHCVYHPADLLSLQTRKAWQEEFGAIVNVLDQQALKEVEPHLSDDIIGAIQYPEEAHVYSPDYVKALEEACRQHGVRIEENLGAVSVEQYEQGVLLQAENKNEYTADQLIVSSGAWAKELEDLFELSLPIFPIRGQICAYERQEEQVNHILYTSQGYLVPKANGTLVNGASEDIAGFQTDVTEKGIQRLINWNTNILPFLAEREPFHTWAGLRPATQDGYPFIGPLTKAPNVYFACGHYRNGILLSAITAKVVAEELSGEQASVPLTSFRPERFT
ncbi:glycine oxidase ThiO [Shouchella shacheensis]|uniref:glycine oxidase ThiO n=1 Tax=Shouchella shacheensis TaxID=1649580 RepID=UPI000740481C|nr:glycine oxidase ThiO [Shouchella shacheensis]